MSEICIGVGCIIVAIYIFFIARYIDKKDAILAEKSNATSVEELLKAPTIRAEDIIEMRNTGNDFITNRDPGDENQEDR